MKKHLITALALGIVLLAGCSKPNPQPATEPTTETAAVTLATEETVLYTPTIQQQAKKEGNPVETPYFTFYTPKRWTELTAAEVTQNGETCHIIFRATVNQLGEFDLFTLCISPENMPEGHLIGTLDGINFYNVMHEHDTTDWAEEDRVELGRQQEFINELILQLLEEPGFTQS